MHLLPIFFVLSFVSFRLGWYFCERKNSKSKTKKEPRAKTLESLRMAEINARDKTIRNGIIEAERVLKDSTITCVSFTGGNNIIIHMYNEYIGSFCLSLNITTDPSIWLPKNPIIKPFIGHYIMEYKLSGILQVLDREKRRDKDVYDTIGF